MPYLISVLCVILKNLRVIVEHFSACNFEISPGQTIMGVEQYDSNFLCIVQLDLCCCKYLIFE